MEIDMAGDPKRRKRTTSSLPDEIINEILLLLPARSVLRFRAVCRQWAAHLSSPGFTGAYAAKAEARRMSKLVVFGASPGQCSTTVYSGSCVPGDAATDPLFVVDRLRTEFLSLSSRPSSGLMLLRNTRTSGRNFWVCNPSTGECMALPQPRPWGMIKLSSAGIVSDVRTKHCKAVHLFTKDFDLECEVYRLGDSGGRWRPPTTDLPRRKISAINAMARALQTEDAVTKVPPVSAGGCLHWLIYPSFDGWSPDESRGSVLRFSATYESFDFVDAPSVLGMGEVGIWRDEYSPAVPFHLAELKGSLCMVHDLRHWNRGNDGRCSLEIWVLKDRIIGGAGIEWSLDYHIAVGSLARDVHNPRFITILGCYSGGEGCKQDGKLLVATSEHKVYAYAPDTRRVEMVFSAQDTAISLQKEANAGLWIGIYEDNLVRVGGEYCRRVKEVPLSMREILLRLPLKSIVQSMLVCKEWCMLIKSDSFVATHMSMNRSQGIVMASDGSAQRAFFGFASLENWLGQASPARVCSLINGNIICSKPCYGLNLISTRNNDYVCNPCTGAIQCLGIRGRSRLSPRHTNRQQIGRHAFEIGRNIGFGFDCSTGEHVAVEIGYLNGTPACMIKTSESGAWTWVGAPPMPVTDMPPAHVDGTLYWMGEHVQSRVIIVAFDISSRAFSILPCEQPLLIVNEDQGAFLVELNSKLSLVIADREAEEMKIWTIHEHGVWVEAHIVRLRGHADFSPTRTVAVPLKVSVEDGTILLNTGRALGYYHTKTGTIDTIYSLDQMQLAPGNLAFPMLCQESLVRLRDERDAPLPADTDNSRHIISYEHPEHADAVVNEAAELRPIFPKCQNAGCLSGYGEIYSNCCKRVICRKCLPQCLQHYQGQHVPLNTLSCENVIQDIQRRGLPLEHPFVPDPDYYCYYYSARNGDVARHVFVAITDFVQGNQPCHLTECAYRMVGHGGVRETWVRRNLIRY